MNTRNESLDALRGFAILAMILSGTIAFGDVLPAWMFHAQVPPPDHKFNAAIPGITWVDLVFPFFLFSMGAAIPLSLKKHLEAGNGFPFVFWTALKRFLLLAFFALFSHHMKAWVISGAPSVEDHLLSMLGFVLLFFQFYESGNTRYKVLLQVTKVAAFAAGVFLLWELPFWGGKGFDLYKSDIIILVLANMAFFGALIYFFTADRPALRIGLLPFVMAVILAAKEPAGGWAKTFFNFSHIGEWTFDWLYRFSFLKYLFIIIPGTLAGEWMLKQVKSKPGIIGYSNENWLALLSFLLIVLNLYGLFSRELLLNLLGSAALSFSCLFILRRSSKDHLLYRFASAGTYLLLLGLFFESYEGGIKKDPSTYSYYFVTTGLAFYSLVVFSVVSKRKLLSGISNFLALNGKNPMVAYVAGNLLLLPLLQITQVKVCWDSLNTDPFTGFMKGVVFTAVVSLITVFFVRRKWYWKT